MQIKIGDKLIYFDSNGYVFEVVGSNLIPTVLFDLHGNVLAGIEWAWDVIEKQQGREVQYLFLDTKTSVSTQYN